MNDLLLKNFKQFSLGDKKIFDEYLAKHQTQLADYTFLNMFPCNYS